MPQLVALLVTAFSTSSVGVVVGHTGFSDENGATFAARAIAEVEATGVTAVAAPLTSNAQLTCVADAMCARGLATTLSATHVVAVDVLRAGSRVAVNATLVDAEGAVIATESAVVGMSDVLEAKAQMLPATVRSALLVIATTVPSPTVATPATTTMTATPSAAAAATTSTVTDDALDPIVIAGVGTAAVGALFMMGGTAAALGQNAVRLDAGANGEDRENTAVTIPLAAGVAAVGLVGVAVGVYLLTSGETSAGAGL